MKHIVGSLLLALSAPGVKAQEVLYFVESPKPKPGGGFSHPMAGVPDVNGDGRGDFIVGATGEDGGGLNAAGRAHVFDGASGTPLYSLESPAPLIMANFGNAVASVEDLDDDGRDDLLVGALHETAAGVSGAGKVHIYSGATGDFIRTIISPDPQPSGRFGRSLTRIPDLDGDGTDDFFVGAPLEGIPPKPAGRVYAFSGATGEPLYVLTSPDATFAGQFGRSIAPVPDADGDGRDDLLVGAYEERVDGLFAAGRAYLFSGATGALLSTLVSPEPVELGEFGNAVAGVPDVDGDGRGDLLVGAPHEWNGEIVSAGRAHLFSGATGAFLRSIDTPTPSTGSLFGLRLLGLPDGDGDGRGDLLVGAPYEPGGAPRSGQVHVFSGADGARLGTLVSPQAEEGGLFGYSFALVPDTDGDGIDEVLIGAIGEAGDAGRVYVFADVVPTNATPDPGPAALRLSIAPNPLQTQGAVAVSLPAPMTVRLAVYDLLGREVARLAEGTLTAGAHHIPFDASALPAGVYVCRLEAAGSVRARTLAVVR